MEINLGKERKLWKKGFRFVAGLDEAGRGPVAGPVVAVAVGMGKLKNKKLKNKIQNLLKTLKDSKKLTAKKREEIFRMVKKCSPLKWKIAQVSEKVIDKINILEATKLAMKRALKKFKFKPDFLIIDGNFKIDLPIPQESIIKADEKIFSVALASILAKVVRDEIMKKYHQKYPQYGFNNHKGYLTKFHLKKLKKYGPCKIHRKSFTPVKNLVK